MRFTILQQHLISAIQSVSRSVGVRSQLPALSNILIQANNGELKLSATNLEIGVVKKLSLEIEEDGELSVPARTLVEVVSNLTNEKLEMVGTEAQLTVITTNFSSQINGISASEFPAIPLSGTEMIRINPQSLVQVLPQVTYAAAVDEGRPVLAGILIEFKDKIMELVATDGYRLAYRSIPVDDRDKFKVLIPRRTLEEVLRLITEEETDNLVISTSDDANQIIFTFGSTQLSSRLIEGQFPNWEKIVPTETKSRVIVDRSEILKAVKLASVFARSEANIVKLLTGSSKLTLSSQAKELGSQQKEIGAQCEGEEMEIAFNVKFLQEALQALSGTQVTLELSGPLSAAILKPVGGEGATHIVMPVNLS